VPSHLAKADTADVSNPAFGERECACAKGHEMFGRSRYAIRGRRKDVDDVDEAYRDVRGEQAHEPCGYPNRRQRLMSRFSSAKPKEDDVMIGNQSDKPEAQHDNE
jgi:hypothetical protein